MATIGLARPGPGALGAIPLSLLPWLLLAVFAAVCISLRTELDWIVEYPRAWVIPLNVWVNTVTDWIVDTFKPLFRGISWLLGWPMNGFQWLFTTTPWPVLAGLMCLLAHRAGGPGLAVFGALAQLYVLAVGYWVEAMNTLALVAVSVPLSVGIGFVGGVLAFRSARAYRVILPLLDLMQTIPTFAYLIPILMLFGFGPVVGLIASAIYAAPPMVRNTLLGLHRVEPDIVESGLMSGCRPRQLFWWVQVPTALPQIMVGVNQTTMAALSMVIIASIIGGFDDIGWEVLSTMRKAQFGQSLLAGLVIALIAMLVDRTSRGLADREPASAGQARMPPHQRPHLIAAVLVVALGLLAGLAYEPFHTWPRAWELALAQPINDAVTDLVANYKWLFDAVKNAALFFVLLPLRIGLETAVSPFSWGIELTNGVIAVFVALMAGLGALGWRFGGWPMAVTVSVGALTIYYGTTGLPWPVTMSIVVLTAFLAGGWQIALFALLGMVFILVNGVWEQAMLSVYLCGAAVAFSFVVGGALGVWAAHSDRVSAVLRPINDTLQTMPQFVLLIPALMLFQVGDFTALLAVIAYAIVPPIRYVESGLRNLPHDQIEAARQMGCTPAQILVQVKLPLALPEILLGLNQTIMFGLAMLVIAALVGTKGLGQAVYLALGEADAGKGLITGLSIAFIAMIADRVIQHFASERKAALGLQ